MIYEDRTRAEEKPSHVVHEDQTKKAKLDVILDRGTRTEKREKGARNCIIAIVIPTVGRIIT